MITRSLHIPIHGCPPVSCRLLQGWLCLRSYPSLSGSQDILGLPLQCYINIKTENININITSHSQLRIRLHHSTYGVQICPGHDLVRPQISSRGHCTHISINFRVISYRPVPPCNIIISSNIIITILTYHCHKTV